MALLLRDTDDNAHNLDFLIRGLPRQPVEAFRLLETLDPVVCQAMTG